MLIASSTIASLTWSDNAGQMPSVLGENVWRLRVYPLQSRIMSLKKSFAKLSTRLELKLMIGILNPAIGSQGRAIVKFSHRKDCQQLMKVKKDSSKLNLTDIDLGKTKIFINKTLCPYYKLLWSKSKKLHAMKQIHSYYVSNDTVKVKLEQTSRPFSITHATDFDKHFPGIDLSSPS